MAQRENAVSADCIFCRPDRAILAESERSLAFLDSYPVSSGHALVVPRRHLVSIWDLSAGEYADAFNLVRRVKDLLQEQFEPQGFNIGVNCGAAAGQSVWHAHIHVIPRYAGDVANPKGGVRNVVPGKGGY
jgi:diadenosine tetraphosphate (Ap4A) HIT family hydrolase